ncbi:MAG: hypothetical protein AAF658_18835, partial [Myxococcota bacterium]
EKIRQQFRGGVERGEAAVGMNPSEVKSALGIPEDERARIANDGSEFHYTKGPVVAFRAGQVVAIVGSEQQEQGQSALTKTRASLRELDVIAVESDVNWHEQALQFYVKGIDPRKMSREEARAKANEILDQLAPVYAFAEQFPTVRISWPRDSLARMMNAPPAGAAKSPKKRRRNRK